MYNLLDDVQSTILMGAGPSSVAPSTYHAMSRNTLGHMDPYFLKIMDELMAGLRVLFGTDNLLTIPLSGTGSLGMEAAFVNLVEAGDKVLILQNGVFGVRMVEVATRLGAEVTEIAFPWGMPVDLDDVEKAIRQDDFKIVAVVMAETSTGVLNPVKEIGALIKDTGALYIVDAVTAIGGMPIEVDQWGIDVCYAGSQKCLSCPPGASPITFSPKAIEVIEKRKTKIPNWYVDMRLLTEYMSGGQRVYHHTPPINMMYGLYQAVLNILEEGPDKVYERHVKAHQHLIFELDQLGWSLLVDEPYRLPMLNAVLVPAGVDEAALRKTLLNDYHIEISAGLGALAGDIVRVGLMGYNANVTTVDRLVTAMRKILSKA